MKWHPFATVFPMLSDSELEVLADDIRVNGLRNPIIVDAQDRIIDGRNRSAACILANVKPVTEVFTGDTQGILRLVTSLNANRRHLTESQRAMAAAQLAQLASSNIDGECRNSDTSKPITQLQAAELLNVSRESVNVAAKINRTAPEIASDVTAGKVSVNKAAKVAKLAPAEQQKARAAGYKETRIDPPSCAMKYAEQAVTILSRIREDDEQRRAAFDYVSNWVEKHFPA